MAKKVSQVKDKDKSKGRKLKLNKQTIKDLNASDAGDVKGGGVLTAGCTPKCTALLCTNSCVGPTCAGFKG